jgi:hypothetical protein
MDVRSCRKAGATSREAQLRSGASRSLQRALSGGRHKTSCFLLTLTYMDVAPFYASPSTAEPVNDEFRTRI